MRILKHCGWESCWLGAASFSSLAAKYRMLSRRAMWNI